jgi:hypothetical protein
MSKRDSFSDRFIDLSMLLIGTLFCAGLWAQDKLMGAAKTILGWYSKDGER